LPGFGPLTAAKLVGEIAGAGRFATDAKLARAAGVAPIAVSSGKTNRHRLDRGGNRQINATIHRIAVTGLRRHPETQDHIARKRAEGKSTKDAIRCLTVTSPPPLAPAPNHRRPTQTITPSIS
jgi:transposase